MGFFDDIGETLFGTKTKEQGRDLANKSAQALTDVGNQAATLRAQNQNLGSQFFNQAQPYDIGAAQSMGANAQDYMARANVAAKQQAEQSANDTALQGTQSAIRAARTAGLSKGQAALAAGQGAGDLYSQAYNQGLESGRGQYSNATQQFANQGQQMSGRGAQMYGQAQNALNTQLGAATGQGNLGQQQQQNANQTAQGTWGTVGTIAGAMAMSDENVKENIYETGRKSMDDFNIDDIAKKIRPVKFDYKKEGFSK